MLMLHRIEGRLYVITDSRHRRRWATGRGSTPPPSCTASSSAAHGCGPYTEHSSSSTDSWQRQQRRKKTVIKHYNEVQPPKVKRDSNDSISSNINDNDNEEETVEINTKEMAVRYVVLMLA